MRCSGVTERKMCQFDVLGSFHGGRYNDLIMMGVVVGLLFYGTVGCWFNDSLKYIFIYSFFYSRVFFFFFFFL